MRKSNIETMEYILRRGVNPQTANSDCFNAIHYAVLCENLEVLSYLIQGKELGM
jgi:hypothetical protein